MTSPTPRNPSIWRVRRTWNTFLEGQFTSVFYLSCFVSTSVRTEPLHQSRKPEAARSCKPGTSQVLDLCPPPRCPPQGKELKMLIYPQLQLSVSVMVTNSLANGFKEQAGRIQACQSLVLLATDHINDKQLRGLCPLMCLSSGKQEKENSPNF